MGLYKDLLSKGKDVIAALELPFKVKKEKKNLEMKILELEQQMAKDELTIQEQKSANPVNWEQLIRAMDAKALNERKLEQMKELEEEMFGENEEKKSE
jgi:hypothetical protein